MIICKTPFRLSLFGGGTDFPKYYMKNGGYVVGGTIDKYCYVTARHLPNVFSYKHRIVWSKNETVNKISDIVHPTVQSVFKLLKIKKGLEIHYQGDLQKNSGLGTSSSFCVGLLNSLGALENKYYSKIVLATKAIFVEQNMLKENCGSQDQIWASYGGFNYIQFKNNGSFLVNKINLPEKILNYFNDSTFLVYTEINRFSNDVEKDKLLNIDKNINYLDQIKNLTLKFIKEINNKFSLKNFGYMLNDYWELKKKLSNKVSNIKINEIYKTSIESGALGGKVIGSGGGGFILFCCEKKNQSKFEKNLRKLPIIKFKFINEGSQIIFNK